MAFQSRAISAIFLLIVTLLSSATAAFSNSVVLEWDPNSETDLAGYKVFYGMSSGEYSSAFDAGLVTEYAVDGLQQGFTYYFALKAYDDSGNESGFSGEVEYTVGQEGEETLRLVTPNGGEKLTVGEEFNVEWEANPDVSKIRIWFSSDFGRNWELVKGNTGNDGHWTWEIPEVYSDSCLVRLEEFRNPETFDISEDCFTITGVGLGVDQERGPDIPGSVELGQNYPNPFNPMTRISFTIPGGEGNFPLQRVTMMIFDSRGRLVKKLLDDDLPPGVHNVYWDGRTRHGGEAASGIYMYTLRVGEQRCSPRKMVLAR